MGVSAVRDLIPADRYLMKRVVSELHHSAGSAEIPPPEASKKISILNMAAGCLSEQTMCIVNRLNGKCLPHGSGISRQL